MLKEGFLCPYWVLFHCLASWQFYSSFLQAVPVSLHHRHTWTLWWTSPLFLGVESLSQIYISASVLGAFLSPSTMVNEPSQPPLHLCPPLYHPPNACSENTRLLALLVTGQQMYRPGKGGGQAGRTWAHPTHSSTFSLSMHHGNVNEGGSCIILRLLGTRPTCNAESSFVDLAIIGQTLTRTLPHTKHTM